MKKFRMRLAVFSLFTSIALGLALATNYVYQWGFVHDRYWNGTLDKVASINAEIISSLLTNIRIEALPHREEEFQKIFAPLHNKSIIMVKKNSEIIFNNNKHNYAQGRLIKSFPVGVDYSVDIFRYSPPSWSDVHNRWLISPRSWFGPKYDFITIPFLGFLIIYLSMLIIIGLVAKSRYLEKDVLEAIRKYENDY